MPLHAYGSRATARKFIVGIFVFVLHCAWSELGKTQQNVTFECIPKTANVTPPPSPPRVAFPSQTTTTPPPNAPIGTSLCPAGEVPVAKQTGSSNAVVERPKVLKGNPLLVPGAPANGPDSKGLPSPAPTPMKSLRFEDLYRQPSLKKLLGPTSPSCLGILQDGSCYYYSASGSERATIGAGMLSLIEKPSYVDTQNSAAGHTLDEVAVQGGTSGGNIVELGWIVSTDQNGDPDPHIFVFHWANWDQSCYNGCGWQQTSDIYYPGQNLTPLVGTATYIGFVFYQGNWWAWFNDQWLGYFPGSLWDGGFAQSTLTQWFGEVATANGIPPADQMGNGLLPVLQNSAKMSGLCEIDTASWTCAVRDDQSLGPSPVPKYYDIKRTGYGEVGYGGPGK